MRRIRVPAPVLLGVLLLAALPMPAARSGAVTVSVVPAETTVTVGDAFTLRVVTGAFPDLKGFETIHAFDASRITLLGADPGDVLTSPGGAFSAFLVPDVSAPADSAWYDAAILDGSSAGPGILAFLRFHADAVGDAAITCRLADFRDSNNARTLAACEGAVVHVAGPVPARRGTWGRIRTLYR